MTFYHPSLILSLSLIFLHPICSFVHPGVLVSKAQLDFIKSSVATQSQPIYAAFQKAQSSPYGALEYTPKGPPSSGIIECGYYSKPDYGCTSAAIDSTAAMTQALLWYITGNSKYAENTIKLMNTYGQHLKGYNNSNAPLQAGWDSEKWPVAAEIIRHSNAGWSSEDIQVFSKMLSGVIQPMIQNGSGANGNWELSMIDGMMGISVFNENEALFNHAISFWKERVPAYFYYHTDGSKPKPPPRGDPTWYGQKVFNLTVDGVAQETCRDFGHTEFGISGATHAAETAHIQGVNLYESEKERLVSGLEFHAHYLLGYAIPNYVCDGKVSLGSVPTFEVGYNEYHNRLGVEMPNTLEWIEKGVRSQKDPVNINLVVFETLTHGANAPQID